jgi:hypothetical protein
MADLNFVADEVDNAEPSKGFEPMPVAWYSAVVIESEMKDTSAGKGKQLALKWQIIEGEHEGRFVWDRVTLQNPTAKAVEIGMSQLKAIAVAVGHTGKLTDSAELHGIPCSIKLKLRPERTDQASGKTYGASNEISAYKSLDASATAKQSAAIAASAARPAKPAPASPAAKPWMRNKNPAN